MKLDPGYLRLSLSIPAGMSLHAEHKSAGIKIVYALNRGVLFYERGNRGQCLSDSKSEFRPRREGPWI